MDLQLQGQGVVVVGGANGIGRAIASRFAAEGASVAILDRDEAAGADTAAELSANYPPAMFAPVDAVETGSFEDAKRSVDQQLTRVDHLVYAAGMGSGKFGFPFWNLEPTDWLPVLDINLIGAVRFVQAFKESLTTARSADRCDASVLVISSIAGQIGSQTDPPYSAAKAALLNFTRCAARDLAPWKTRVNAICPGMIKTELNRSVWRAWREADPEQNSLEYDDWAESKIAKIAPLGRWQEAEEVAALAAYLASPWARNITGQTLNVDGGQVMH